MGSSGFVALARVLRASTGSGKGQGEGRGKGQG